MKRIGLLLCTFFALIQASHAQGIGAFFSQQSTELKYYAQQIAAYEVYVGWLEKGYRIAQNGLTTIRDIKKGEFNLHEVFFASLETVNPAIAKNGKIAEIISDELTIIQQFKKITALPQMSPGEVSYLTKVHSHMASECAKSLTELIVILTDNSLQLTDGQRIKRIDTIWADTKDKAAFTQSFASDARMLSAQRAQESNEVNYLQILY